jgi:hypothetical protein
MTTRVPLPRMDAETLSALAVVYMLTECERPKGREKIKKALTLARSEAGRGRVVDFRNGKTPEQMLAALDRVAALLELVLAASDERTEAA